MATNAEDKADEKAAADDGEIVTDEDFKKLKGEDEVESSDEETDDTSDTEESEEESEETSEEDGQTDDQAEEESDEEASFVKEFPNIKGDTLEEYLKNVEVAYRNSTSEALRLKKLTDEKPEDDKIDTSDPIALFMKQKMDDEINTAFDDFKKEYSQVSDDAEYGKFVSTVSVLSNTILQSEKRLASPKELYSKTAVILGWDPQSSVDGKEKLGTALKNSAATSKISTSPTKPKPKSKVSEAEIEIAKQMWASDKSDAEIRKELEAVKS